nr:ATPase, F1/V1/A1 complex, alpha/beta subunit, zinc knuckle CX2CX4HX4C [Tanacetum cinerariifolium]
MATKGNLGEVVTTCERSWVQASPWGFYFKSEKKWGLSPKAKVQVLYTAQLDVTYNIKIIWGRHGLKDIVVDSDEMCYFKFRNEEGISTISSRLGRLIKMDKMTADMCKKGAGRLGFARVLVEINVEDKYLDKVKISYVDELRNFYKMKPKQNKNNHKNENTQMKNERVNEEGFVKVKHKRNTDDNNKGYYGSKGNKQQVRQDVGDKYVAKPKAHNPKIVNGGNKVKGPKKFHLRKFGNFGESREKDEGDSEDEENVEDLMNDITECMSDNEINGLDNQLMNDGKYDRRVIQRQMQKQESKVYLVNALDTGLVVTESSGTKFGKQEQATGQQYAEQPEFNNEGMVDQDVEQC